jgi:hypothetical protein
MTNLLNILAQRSSDDGEGGWIKLLFGALVFLFWAISAIATWLNKKHEEARRQRLRDQLNHGVPEPGVRPAPARERVGVRLPPPPPASMHPPMPKRFPQRAPKPPRQPAKRARAVPVPPPPLPALQEVTGATTLPVTATEIAATPSRSAAAAARATTVSAASIAHWLRPQTLHQQFILTEILQPPLALRPPRE